jgi:hypothetical protein
MDGRTALLIGARFRDHVVNLFGRLGDGFLNLARNHVMRLWCNFPGGYIEPFARRQAECARTSPSPFEEHVSNARQAR